MHSLVTRTGPIPVVLAATAYVLIGVLAALLARTAGSPAGTVGWRLIAWILSAGVFLLHLALAHSARTLSRVRIATQVALAVAIAALVLALVGPVRSHWGDASRARLLVLAPILWPVLTGVPAFGVALAFSALFVRRDTR